MRELVYLSESKLTQFLSAPRGGWRVKGSVTTPVGSLDVDPVREPDTERARRLERVIEHVARSARWFAEDGLRPGQWVQFDAPLNYSVLDERYFHRMLVFLDSGRPAPGYPTGGSVRLLLHGSARHLAGTPSSVQVAGSVEDTTGDGGQSSGGYVHLARNVELLIGAMTSAETTTDGLGGLEDTPFGPTLQAATRRLVGALETRMYPETAAWMTGYARVTVALQDGETRYVVASPLNVEHTDPPERPCGIR